MRFHCGVVRSSAALGSAVLSLLVLEVNKNPVNSRNNMKFLALKHFNLREA